MFGDFLHVFPAYNFRCFRLTVSREKQKVISKEQIGIAFLHHTGIQRNAAGIRLTENKIEAGYGNLSALHQFTEDIACTYTGKLIGISNQKDGCTRFHAGKQFLGKCHIYHRKLIGDDEILGKIGRVVQCSRIILVCDKPERTVQG